jgi:hypothetical protein
MLQASDIAAFGQQATKPTKHMQQHARDLLSTALLKTNTPPAFLHSHEFQQYVKLISHQQYTAPSRYLHLQTVKEIGARCRRQIATSLTSAVAFSIEEDSWCCDGRRFSAVTAGVTSTSEVSHRLSPIL